MRQPQQYPPTCLVLKAKGRVQLPTTLLRPAKQAAKRRCAPAKARRLLHSAAMAVAVMQRRAVARTAGWQRQASRPAAAALAAAMTGAAAAVVQALPAELTAHALDAQIVDDELLQTIIRIAIEHQIIEIPVVVAIRLAVRESATRARSVLATRQSGTFEFEARLSASNSAPCCLLQSALAHPKALHTDC